MNWKKIIRVFGIIIGASFLVLICAFGYFYYQYYGKYETNEKKYPHHIGYLSPENIDFNKGFSRCNPGKLPRGFYHSSAEFAFRKNKKLFKNRIIKGFDPTGYSESGFLNIRFIINCRGEIGDIEINELDTEFKPTNFNDDLVEQILDLSLKNENWKPFDKKEGSDMYMYLIFKLENGKISEILP